MNSEVFLKTHRESWEKFNKLLQRLNKKGGNLNKEELKLIGPLFRRITAHLSYARSNYPNHEMISYLNNLVVKAHGIIYKKETMGFSLVWRFLRHDFPRQLIKEQRLIFLAAGILLLGVATGWLIHSFQPYWDENFIPAEFVTEKLESGEVGATGLDELGSLLSTAIMLNNIKVGILSFALGVTWGLGTSIVLYSNGITLGVLGAIYTAKGYAAEFWSLILPHGCLELMAIFICGGAGFALAEALARPGDFKRFDALSVRGKSALKLVLGTIPMFVIAGIIEGYITPSPISKYMKFAVAGVSSLLFLWYVIRADKRINPGRR